MTSYLFLFLSLEEEKEEDLPVGPEEQLQSLSSLNNCGLLYDLAIFH